MFKTYNCNSEGETLERPRRR